MEFKFEPTGFFCEFDDKYFVHTVCETSQEIKASFTFYTDARIFADICKLNSLSIAVFITTRTEHIYFWTRSIEQRNPVQSFLLHRTEGLASSSTCKQTIDPAPIDMILNCPHCGLRHVDKPDSDLSVHMDGRETMWTNPPHKSHLCESCGFIWRPADVPTNGVASIKTKGMQDSKHIGAKTWTR